MASLCAENETAPSQASMACTDISSSVLLRTPGLATSAAARIGLPQHSKSAARRKNCKHGMAESTAKLEPNDDQPACKPLATTSMPSVTQTSRFMFCVHGDVRPRPRQIRGEACSQGPAPSEYVHLRARGAMVAKRVQHAPSAAPLRQGRGKCRRRSSATPQNSLSGSSNSAHHGAVVRWQLAARW